MEAIFRRSPAKQNLRFLMVTITSSNSCVPRRLMHTGPTKKNDEGLALRTFDLIRDAVLPEYRERVAEYLVQYETVLLDKNTDDAQLIRDTAHQLRGYLRGLNTTRVLGMAYWEELDRRVVDTWLRPQE
ncbi:hypothetical protein M2426_003107 [Pseudomonas moraviensis]